MRPYPPRCFTVLVTMVLVTGMAPAPADPGKPPPLTVFAAASLKEAVDTLAVDYRQTRHHTVRAAYAATPTLARQIEQGAPADIFISADKDWMDYLDQRGRLVAGTRSDMLGNTLVLIAARSNNVRLTLAPGTDLLGALAGGRLAIAKTDSVPAGKYGRTALTTLGLWARVKGHLVETENVRAALLLVARAEAPLGVVYGSDAVAEPAVRVVDRFPVDSYPAIVYAVAVIRGTTHPAAGHFAHWLRSPQAAAVFRRYGFMPF